MTALETIQQNTPEWLEARRRYIGASDAPAILGLSQWSTPTDVALEKRGLATTEENDAMRRGHLLESVVAELYARQTGRMLSRCNSVVHPEYSFIAASPDRIIDEETLLECKTHSARVRAKYGEPGTDQVSDYEFVQVQHQMACTGASSVEVAILFGDNEALRLLADMVDHGVAVDVAANIAGGNMEFCVYHIPRDDSFINEDLIPALEEFWEEYVLGEKIPEDIRTMTPRNAMRIASSTENRSIEELKLMWIQLERSKISYETKRRDVEDYIGDAAGIETTSGIITWKKTNPKPKRVTDWEALARRCFECMTNDEAESLLEEFTRTEQEDGKRVFRVPAHWKKELEGDE